MVQYEVDGRSRLRPEAAEAEARGCRGWGPETLRAPWRLALTSVMESCQDWSFKNMTQYLKEKKNSNIIFTKVK